MVPVSIPISGFLLSIYFTQAVNAVPTESVFVNTIGDSIVPSSSIWIRPCGFEKPFTTWLADRSFSLNMFSLGTIAVTPVCIPPLLIVT